MKTAEELASKGDTKGQKDQIINELVKVHQRFQARITEYQILLKMTIQFFGSLHQVSINHKSLSSFFLIVHTKYLQRNRIVSKIKWKKIFQVIINISLVF